MNAIRLKRVSCTKVLFWWRESEHMSITSFDLHFTFSFKACCQCKYNVIRTEYILCVYMLKIWNTPVYSEQAFSTEFNINSLRSVSVFNVNTFHCVSVSTFFWQRSMASSTPHTWCLINLSREANIIVISTDYIYTNNNDVRKSFSCHH